jgi:tRNA-specific 2-thiouridylase
LTKDEVRAIAAAHGFASADRKDSQDICFLPDGNYADFIRRYAGHVPSPGKFVDRDGNVLGDHPGMLHYTIGQRKGLGIALGRPMYVCDKNAQTGDVVLCDDEQLYSRTLTAKSVNFIPFDRLTAPMRVEAKIRYAHKAAPATVYPTGENTVRVEFDLPQRAIARGQSVVFYDGDLLIGGGIIE